MSGGMALLLLASGAVLLASVAIVAELPRHGVLASLLAVGLVSWATIEVIVGAAGLLVRDLSPVTLLGLALAEVLLAALAAWRLGTAQRTMGRIRASIPAVRAVLWSPIVAGAVVLGVLMLAWRTVLAIRLPVVDLLGWQYHLVTADVWIQANQIVRVSQNNWTDGYPAGGELLTTWLMAFPHSDALAGLTGLLPIPLAMVACAGLARSLGARPGPALLAGLLFGMIPAIVVLAGTTYPDTASVAAVVATWWLGLRMLRGEEDRSTAALFGIAAGLAIATKGTTLALVVPMFAVMSLRIVWDAASRLQGCETRLAVAWTGLSRLALVLLPFLLLGGSWYLKNLIVHGNPVYPVAFGPFAGPAALGSFGPPVPRQLAGEGTIEQILRSWAFDWRVRRYLYDVRPGGFGLEWLPVLLLAALGLIDLVRNRRVAALAMVVAIAAVALAVQPSPWYARYTLYVPAVAFALAAIALTGFKPRLRAAAGLVLVGLAAISLVAADLQPNISIRLPSGWMARSEAYLAFVLGATNAQRSAIDRRARCAAFDRIPVGDRVAVDRGYFVPHAVVGTTLSRILTEPIEGVSDDAGLVLAMRLRSAQWLVTTNAGPMRLTAAADQIHFTSYGAVCSGGTLWRFVPG
jgi:4-amino-4-deoxy-L-arabinose transferase-like glycosyltransferase